MVGQTAPKTGRDFASILPEPNSGPDTGQVWSGLVRRTRLIIGCTLVAAASALVFSLLQTTQYSADAALLFRDSNLNQQILSSTVAKPILGFPAAAAQDRATNAELASLKIVANLTARDSGHGLSGDEVTNAVVIGTNTQSDITSITATNPSPEVAASLANSFARNVIAFRRSADRLIVQRAIGSVKADLNRLSPSEQNSQRGGALERQISRLSALLALQAGSVELVQRATVPDSPSSPKTVQNVVLGGILGLLIGLGLAILLERLDHRLRDPQELEDAFGIPVLAVIPESKPLGRSGAAMRELSASDEGAFQFLRTRLRYFNVEQDIRSLLVTSASSREGRTTVSWGLAAGAAAAGLRSILVEADFRQPTVAERIGGRLHAGLAELLSAQGSLKELVQQVAVGDQSDGGGKGRHLDVIVSGSLPPNPAELLGSEGMTRLIEMLNNDYDLVVIDTPPLLLVADAIPLIKMVDGVIVVGQINRTTRDEAHDLRRELERLQAPVLGTVANRARRPRWGQYGKSGHGKESRSDDVRSTVGSE